MVAGHGYLDKNKISAALENKNICFVYKFDSSPISIEFGLSVGYKEIAKQQKPPVRNN